MISWSISCTKSKCGRENVMTINLVCGYEASAKSIVEKDQYQLEISVKAHEMKWRKYVKPCYDIMKASSAYGKQQVCLNDINRDFNLLCVKYINPVMKIRPLSWLIWRSVVTISSLQPTLSLANVSKLNGVKSGNVWRINILSGYKWSSGNVITSINENPSMLVTIL